MSDFDFDFEAQRVETERLWAEMSEGRDLPGEGMVDLTFVAGEGADATEFMGWLEDEGYDVEHYEADEEDEEDPEETVEVQTPAMPLSAATIHAEERRTTEAALRYGFLPRGWGFIGT